MTAQSNRFKTREVKVGPVGVGGSNPIRVQSMTTSPTHDVEATVAQIKKLADHGCEIARITVQGMREAESCEAIRNTLTRDGYTIPVVADIHFYPPAAMRCVEFVDKVRVNPGNFVDKRATFKVLEYDDASYAAEIQKIEEKFGPLVDKCRTLGRAMRIGTNHGSLSDRILNRYGDTPAGMVESALEFARVCRARDFHDFIFSMKASNPKVMIEAYRQLVAKMRELEWDYPLHLGVTEAGEGEDGRIKSAMGIGTLLMEGIGDTVRVSLTEDPWLEIDPCKRIVALAEEYRSTPVQPRPERYRPEVKAPLHQDGSLLVHTAEPVDGSEADAWVVEKPVKSGETPLLFVEQASEARLSGMAERFATTTVPSAARMIAVGPESGWHLLNEQNPEVILYQGERGGFHQARRFFTWLHEQKISAPVILDFRYNEGREQRIIHAAAEIGGLLIDELANGLCVAPEDEALGFQILQAARMRRTKTEFISCPSCGRTLFDLQETTRRIREKTDHLPGVAIAIMGCIVNGPGEMADADFGYVGSKAGMVDLYVGKTCVERGIPYEESDERLIDLIKSHGKWVEPTPSEKAST